MRSFLMLAALSGLLTAASSAEAGRKAKVDSKQVVGLTRFLEEQPLHEDAPQIRSLLIDWDEKTKDVVDVVCLDLVFAVANPAVPNGPELMGQFIFGSAAHQLANPADKGKLLPSQMAGLRSMLKVYAAFLAADPDARIAVMDEWLARQAAGTLEGELTAAVASQCADKPADGKPAGG